jgi:uncharacterized protein YjbI with pentapeptide repeats
MAANFANQNLRGRSFTGQDLTGASFVRAKIEGANFSGCNLTGANFSYAQGGLTTGWALVLLALTLIFAALSGYLAAVATHLLDQAFPRSVSNQVVGLFIAMFIWIALRRGIWKAVQIQLLAGVVALTLSSAIYGLLSFASSLSQNTTSEIQLQLSSALALASAVVKAVFITGTGLGAITLAIVSATAMLLGDMIAGMLAMVMFIMISLIVAGLEGSIPGLLMAAIVGTLSGLMAWQALLENKAFIGIKNLAIKLATRGYCTNFERTNLTGANFTAAIVKCSNFNQAKISQVQWYRCRGLEEAKLGQTILHNSVVRNLLVSKKGKKGKFAGLSLRGINLEKADLRGANFSATDLSEANLQGANLSYANFTGANLKNADLRSALMEQTIIGDELSNAKY